MNIQAIFTDALDPDIAHALELDPDLASTLDRDIVRALDLDRDIARVHDLVPGLVRTSNRARTLDRMLARTNNDIALVSVRALSIRALDHNVRYNTHLAYNLDFVCNLARAFTFDRTQDLALTRANVLALAHASARARAHNSASNFALARASASAFTRALISALDLYIDLVLLQERRTGNLLVRECILLVKERILGV